MKRRAALIVVILAATIPVLYNACGRTQFNTVHSTTVNNPLAPVSNEIMYAVCGVINRCNPQVTVEQCEAGLLSTSDFNTPLGLPTSYSTLSSIVSAEETGAIVGNAPVAGECYDAINTLQCSQASAAYNANLPNPYEDAPQIVPTGSCNQVFSVGVNLEVPIELVDYGISSNIKSMTFSRTSTTFNPSDYDGADTFFFEVVAVNGDSSPRNANLVSSSGGIVGAISVPSGTASPTRFRTSFIPGNGADNYRIQLDGTSTSGQLSVYAGRMLVDQVGATKTKIYVPLVGSYSSGPANAVSSADDNTASVDSADQSTPTGAYIQHDGQYYALWRKNDQAFNQLAGSAPFTFEAVISASGAATAVGYISLFDATSGLQIKDSEMTTTSTAPTLVSTTISDGAANFNDLDNIEARIRNDGSGDNAYVYHAGLWITLNQLTHAEVYYRYSKTDWLQLSGHDQWNSQMVLFNAGVFNTATSVYHEESGYVTEAGTPCAEQLLDIGTNDSGTTGTIIPGSSITFSSTTKSLLRTSALSLISGDRFISDTPVSSGPGTCISIHPKIVIGF